MPWATMLYWSRRWWLLAVKPSTCSGAGRDIDSTPPPTTRSWNPASTPSGGEVDGLLARAAEAVEGDAGGVERPAGVERGHAGDVHRVVAAAGAAAHHDVVDVGGVEAVAVLQGVEHLGEDPLRVDVVQRAVLLALAPRRADGVDDPGFRFHAAIVAHRSFGYRIGSILGGWRTTMLTGRATGTCTAAGPGPAPATPAA